MDIWRGKKVFITGGTGTFGRHLVQHLLEQDLGVERVVVYSRDEMKQYEMNLRYGNEPRLRFIIGDVREASHLLRAMKDADIVIHAAALKQVPLGEFHPEEFIKTNILGTENVIHAAIQNEVRQVVSLSTSKSVAPLNLYGATKLCADKLIISANRFDSNTRLATVRFGNIFGSRGSVVPLFLLKKGEGVLPVTHPDMTRFSITVTAMMAMISRALAVMQGGEIFVPKCASYRIGDLARAVDENCTMKIIGLRPGEKMHEEMIVPEEARFTCAYDGYYVIYPKLPPEEQHRLVAPDFAYLSHTNPDFLSVEDLKQMLD